MLKEVVLGAVYCVVKFILLLANSFSLKFKLLRQSQGESKFIPKWLVRLPEILEALVSVDL